MAITIRAASTLQESTSALSDTYVLPTGHTLDDLLLIVHGSRITGSVASSNYTADTGYVETAYVEDSVTVQTEPHGIVFRKFHDGSEVDPTVTTAATPNMMLGTMTALTGVDQTTPIDATPVTSISGSAVTSFTPTGLDTVTDGAWVLSVIWGTGLTNFALSAGSEQGFTLLAGGSAFDAASGQDMGIGIAYKEIATATTVTCPTWTCNSSEVIAATIPFRPASVGPQTLDGNLFTKAPTFPTGTLIQDQILAGTLFTKAPTFFQGSIAQALNGVLFQKAPTFFAGSIAATYALTGTLFTKAPTFPTGTLIQDQILTGSLFTKAPTFFVGSIAQALNGVLFTKAPTFFAGAVTTQTTLAGVLFQKAPTFPQGAITTLTALTGTLFQKAPTFFTGTVTPGAVTLTGLLFTKAPTFFAGTLSQQGGPTLLGGTLFQKAPTFPTGTITTGAVSVTGVLFQKAPTFFVGMVGHQLNGVLFQKAPTFFVGELIPDQALTGVLFVKAPTFPQGVVANAGSLLGVLFVKAPTFFVGTLAQVGGSFWRPNPAGYTLNPVAYTANPAAYDPVLAGDLPPWAIEIDGVVFVKAPLFPVGSVS